MEKISFNEFKKADIRIGTVKTAEKIPDTDKLLKLQVEFGDGEIRQIVSGIAEYYSPDELCDKQFPFVYNLEPRTIRGEESNGMILGVGGDVGFVALTSIREVPPGSGVG